MHLPRGFCTTTRPSKQVERGNILVWEQTLADRHRRACPSTSKRGWKAESILYSTVTLFGAMAAVVVVLFAGIIWWVVRKGRAADV